MENKDERIRKIEMLKKINDKNALDAAEKYYKKHNKLVIEINALFPKIKDIVDVANVCLDNGFEFDYKKQSKEEYKNGYLLAESCGHYLGLIRRPRDSSGNTNYSSHEFYAIGFRYLYFYYDKSISKSDRFFEDVDLIVTKNEIKCIHRRATCTSSGWGSAEIEAPNKLLERFLKEFPAFEEGFYEYIDTLTKDVN